jgi:hypothetical protein
MNIRNWCAKALAAIMVGGAVLTPISATAQFSLDKELKRRQQKKNEWRNLGYAGGAVALYGLLKKDNTLFWAGTAGGLYSAWRYEQDRKSQSRLARDRAALYSRPTVYRNGKRYVRQTVWKNGKKYYRFARG